MKQESVDDFTSCREGKIKRIYHPYYLLEEVEAGMWSVAKNEDEMLKNTIIFMQKIKFFNDAMLSVILRWKYSCEHNLSNYGHNRIAWLGQAACALQLCSPEEITRKAWGFLTSNQQVAANKCSKEVIEIWENMYPIKNAPRYCRRH